MRGTIPPFLMRLHDLHVDNSIFSLNIPIKSCDRRLFKRCAGLAVKILAVIPVSVSEAFALNLRSIVS
jgi:hypothetical protein